MIRYKKYFLILLIFVFGLFLSSCDGLTEFEFDNDYLSLAVGETKKSTSISNDTKEIYYYSGDESVAKVDEIGNVTGVTKGETIIYALFKNEPYRCFVNVTSNESNLEVYERDVTLNGDLNVLGEMSPFITFKARYLGHNNQMELEDNLKIQLTSDFLNVDESKLNGKDKNIVIKDNIKFLALMSTAFYAKYNSASLKPFVDVFVEYNSELSGLSGEELANKIKQLKPLTGYIYASNDYLSAALFKDNNVVAYTYSNEDIGIIPKIKSVVLLFNQLVSKGINFQKIDYLELTKTLNGDLITEELANKLKKYQKIISTLAYVALGELRINKSKIDNDDNKQRITLTVTEDGVNKINEGLSVFKFTTLGGSFDITKDLNTNYNYFDNFILNLGTALGDAYFKVGFGQFNKLTGENLFPYESKHSEYEKLK